MRSGDVDLHGGSFDSPGFYAHGWSLQASGSAGAYYFISYDFNVNPSLSYYRWYGFPVRRILRRRRVFLLTFSINCAIIRVYGVSGYLRADWLNVFRGYDSVFELKKLGKLCILGCNGK